MKSILVFTLTLAAIISYSCSQSQSKTSLLPNDFSKQIEQSPSAVILDVRTPEEYAGGHIENSSNVNWKDSNFEKQISTIDKTKPVFVYCLSGGRSASAAARMRSLGFEKVYELEGGIAKWNAVQLPIVH